MPFPPSASRALRALLLLFALLTGGAAAAHPAPFSYLDVHLRPQGIDGTLTVHVIDAAHDLGIATPEALLTPAVLGVQQHRLEAILTPRLELASGHPLRPEWTGAVPLPAKNAVRLSFHIAEGASGAFGVRTDMFPYDRFHQTFVNLYEGDALRQQWIFGQGSAGRTYYPGTTAGTLAVMRTFVPAGIHHILIGPDHLLFLVGLLLLGGSFGALVRIVTAFTVGHSITLSLAALGIVTPPASIVEPAIALSIVFVGTDNLIRGKGRDLRAWAALFFGLIHGFGFASVLREFGLPREALAASLFSFNVGVEIGQLAVVIPVATLLDIVRRRSQRLRGYVTVAGSVIVIAAGAYWFVQRIIYPGGA